MKKLNLTFTHQIDDQGIMFLSTPCGDMFSIIELPKGNDSSWGFSIIKQGQHKVIDPVKIGSIVFPPDPIGVVQEFLNS